MTAQTVTQVEELPEGSLVAQVERLPGRRLWCGECGRAAGQVAPPRRPARQMLRERWRDDPADAGQSTRRFPARLSRPLSFLGCHSQR